MPASILADAFGHHTWARSASWTRVPGLDDERLATPVPGRYGSIIDTLRHLVGGDVFSGRAA